MKNIFFALGTLIVLVLAANFLPISRINWGKISIQPAGTITVTGTAQEDVTNQVATFNATVTATNADKQTAVNKVNTQMTALLAALKNFGIADADITTQSVNTYQNQAQTLIYPVPPQQTNNNDWTASNSISITLRDVSKASSLTDLLNNSGATNVYGPNLSVDQNTNTDSDLLTKAVADAKTKAQNIAKASGQTLGKIITLNEDGTSSPISPLFATKDQSASSVPAPIQPGTTTMSKSVTVTWELN
ncbi:MAG TPA: SIMPL domain-containing protein [Patescibacteria group bacterium]|nr:SIMPL domain-containing protein [Patescibacteria group bacterium]